MRVFIDTNILISAALNGSGIPYQAFLKAVNYPNHAVVSDQNIDELRRIFNRKFTAKIHLLEQFCALALTVMEVVLTPTEESDDEKHIRDAADRPILRAAIAAKVDVLITGDKDFLESGIKDPRILTASEFMRL